MKKMYCKFLNPGVPKSIPFFSKTARKDHAITRLLDVITHGSGETKWLAAIYKFYSNVYSRDEESKWQEE